MTIPPKLMLIYCNKLFEKRKSKHLGVNKN